MNIKKHVSLGVVLATIAAFGAGIPVFADTNTPPVSSQSRPMRGAAGANRNFGGMGNKANRPRMASSTSTPAIQGNGQPIVAGTVSSVSGSTIAITNKSNVTYTVDASSAKVVGSKDVTSLSNIKIGDAILVQGTINGSSVTASTIIDQAKPSTNASASGIAASQSHMSFFGSIGNFFSHMFGF